MGNPVTISYELCNITHNSGRSRTMRIEGQISNKDLYESLAQRVPYTFTPAGKKAPVVIRFLDANVEKVIEELKKRGYEIIDSR